MSSAMPSSPNNCLIWGRFLLPEDAAVPRLSEDVAAAANTGILSPSAQICVLCYGEVGAAGHRLVQRIVCISQSVFQLPMTVCGESGTDSGPQGKMSSSCALPACGVCIGAPAKVGCIQARFDSSKPRAGSSKPSPSRSKSAHVTLCQKTIGEGLSCQHGRRAYPRQEAANRTRAVCVIHCNRHGGCNHQEAING